jgi:hypothetical protein
VCSFAPTAARVADMSRTKATIATITARDMRKLKDRSFGRRSDVYRYLHKNYKRLVQQKVGTDEGPSWDEIAAVVSEQGYVSARGDPLNGNAVRRVFRRVERDVKRQEMDAARQRVTSPSRQRSDWQPPLAEAPRTAPALPYRRYEPEEELPPRRPSALPPSQAPPATSKPMTIEDLTPEARAKIDRVKSELAEEDRKRFGRF